MNCRDVLDFLMDYDAGRLAPEERALFEDHLSICPSCVAYLQNYRATVRMEKSLGALVDDSVTPELVHPMEPEEVPPLPGFDVTEPNGRQFFLYGHIEGNPTQDYRSTVWPRQEALRHGRPGDDQWTVWTWTVTNDSNSFRFQVSSSKLDQGIAS